MAEVLIVTAENAPRPFDVVGERITVLASGAQTGGYEIFHQVGPEGSGPPPHSHPWDETFYVVAGQVGFVADGKDATAATGTLVHLPAGTVHGFQFGPGGGAMISMTSREAASHMFADFDREISPDHPDLAKLIELGAPYGLTVAVPPG